MKYPVRLRALLTGALLGTLALIPVVVNAQSSQDFVTGGGHHSFPDTQFTISAHNGPQGPKGNFSFKTAGEARIRAEVVCLTVTGNRAVATGVYTDEDGAEQFVVMEAVDNGEPGQTPPDRLRFSFAPVIVEDPQNPGCFLPPSLNPVPVTEGNIVVRDN